MLKSLPSSEWPLADQEAWQSERTPAERFRRGGRASHMRAVTQEIIERQYGTYLYHLAERGELDMKVPAAAQVTPTAVANYLARVRSGWSPVTIARSIQKVRRMAEIMAPHQDWGWLREVEYDLRAEAHPKPRSDRLVDTAVLVESGLREFQSAEKSTNLRPYWRAARMRDGLLMAFLALCPIRLRSWLGLTLNESFVRVGNRWWIVLDGRDTKEKRPDIRRVPEDLNRAVELYLTQARCLFLKGNSPEVQLKWAEGDLKSLTGLLWINEHGQPLGRSGMRDAFYRVTKRTVGRALSPHDFRRCAATTARLHAGAEPYLASALLDHRDPRTVDEHYNLASSLTAAEKYAALMRSLRREGRLGPAAPT
jgi:integrase